MGIYFSFLRRLKQDLPEVRDAGDALRVIEGERSFDLPLSDVTAIRVRDVFPLELITLEDRHGKRTTFAVAHVNAITRLPSPVIQMLRSRAPRAFDGADEGRLSGPVEAYPWWARFPEMLVALPLPVLGVFITYKAGSSGVVNPPPPVWFLLAMPLATMVLGALVYLMARALRSPIEVHLRGTSLIVRESLFGHSRERCIPMSDVVEIRQSGPWGCRDPVMMFIVHMRGAARHPIRFITRQPANAIALLEQARVDMGAKQP